MKTPDLKCFGIIDWCEITDDTGEFLAGQKKITIVSFTADNLECPSVEPIGVYEQAGNKFYFWRDLDWMDCAVALNQFDWHKYDSRTRQMVWQYCPDFMTYPCKQQVHTRSLVQVNADIWRCHS